jgi:hypothetical protein
MPGEGFGPAGCLIHAALQGVLQRFGIGGAGAFDQGAEDNRALCEGQGNDEPVPALQAQNRMRADGIRQDKGAGALGKGTPAEEPEEEPAAATEAELLVEIRDLLKTQQGPRGV